MTQQLSPAAQAILDACGTPTIDSPFRLVARGFATATLRAVADIVTPVDYEDIWTDGRMLQYKKQDPIRDKLLSIANELESIQ